MCLFEVYCDVAKSVLLNFSAVRRMLMKIWSPGDCANHLSTESLLFSGKPSVLACIKWTRERINKLLPVLPTRKENVRN